MRWRTADGKAATTRKLDAEAITSRLDTRTGPLGSGQLEAQPVEPMPGDSGFAGVLRNNAFLRLWLAQATSQTAQNVIWYALFLQIAHLTNGAPAGIGVIIMMVQLPTILFAGLSGVLVDRFSKRSILVSSNAMRAFGCLGYIVFRDHVTALYAITFVVSVINQPFQPAESATIPLVVRDHQLLAANALFQITFMLTQVIGYILAPVLAGLTSTTTTFAVADCFLVFAALVLIPLPAITRQRRSVPLGTARQAAVQMLREIVEVGIVVAKDGPLTVALVQLSLAPAVLLVLAELGPQYVKQILNTGQNNAMIILIAPAGAGLGVGLFLIDRLGQKLPKSKVASLALLAIGVAIIALATVPKLLAFLFSNGLHFSHALGASLLTVPISFVLGMATALLSAPAQTIVQQRASSNLRGRVLAVQQALAAAVTIPCLLTVALVGQVLSSISLTLGILGAVVLVAGVISSRSALKARPEDPAPSGAPH